MATPIRILSCSQHATYHICTHTHTKSEHTAFPAPAVSASLASVSFSECLTGSQALAFSSASLSRGSFFLWNQFKGSNGCHSHKELSLFFPLSSCISSLPLSINQSVSLPLSVSPSFSCCLSPKSLTLHFYRPHFLSSGFCRGTQKPLLMQNHLVHVCTPAGPVTQ